MDIQQTKEAALALASLIKDGLAANVDGKISPLETLSLLAGNASSLYMAARGIGEIPAELKDLQPYELEDVYLTLIVALSLENDNNSRLKVGAVYDLLRQALITVQTFAPPRAEIVAEEEPQP